MQAELATLARPSERWRFALGCTRAALLPSAEARGAWLPFAVTITAAVVAVAEYALATAIGQTVPLLFVLALLAWRGRHPGYFGPVRPDRAARAVRASGYALVAFSLVALIAADGGGLLQPTPANWGPVFAIMLTLLAALFLALTARGTRFGSIGLAAGSLAGLVAGLATFAVMPFEHGGDVIGRRTSLERPMAVADRARRLPQRPRCSPARAPAVPIMARWRPPSQ